MRTEKQMLVDAICGRGFLSYGDADHYVEQGMAKFTGNQWNENWDWIAAKLHALSNIELKEIYHREPQ